MSGRQCTREQFDADTAYHVMTVLLDNGIYRHLRFAKPNTYCMSFNIITWPGSLCITGDMGTYVFERLQDMFEFFRSPSGRINAGYWAEKVSAQCKSDGISVFDMDAMVAHVVEDYREHWVDSGKWGMRLEGFKQLRQEVFQHEDEGSFRSALNDFQWDGFSFSDTWEWNPRQYTFRFIWALYAIVHAIKRWDAMHEAMPCAT